MARKLEEIYDQLTAESYNYTETAILESNSSKMSYWHYVKMIFAFGVLQLEIIFDQLKVEILGALNLDYNVGTPEWYKSICKEFQYGDVLKLKYNTPYYENIDNSKQIVKKVSIKDLPTGGIRIRVQTENNGETVPLSSDQLGAFAIYVGRRKIAGTKTDIQSNNPNIITINARLFISKEVFDATGKNYLTGKYVALDNLRIFFQKQDFDEVLYLSTLSDYMNNIEGVKGFHLLGCTIDGVPVDLTTGKIDLPFGYGKIVETDSNFNLRMIYESI